MKKLIIILLFFTNQTFASSVDYRINSRICPDTTVLTQILSLSLQSYIGKPVDSLFLALPGGCSDRSFKPMGIGYARGVIQGYGTAEFNNCFVEIFIDTFQHLSFPNLSPTTSWNMNLDKLETIAYIKVWKNNTCIYGCSNSNYY